MLPTLPLPSLRDGLQRDERAGGLRGGLPLAGDHGGAEALQDGFAGHPLQEPPRHVPEDGHQPGRPRRQTHALHLGVDLPRAAGVAAAGEDRR